MNLIEFDNCIYIYWIITDLFFLEQFLGVTAVFASVAAGSWSGVWNITLST